MKRTYIAYYDDGHDYGEFEFNSSHRAGSKDNLEDAKRKARLKYGYKRASHIDIYRTQLL